MKQPRASDFDPSVRERQLKSPMEHFPVIEKPGQPVAPDDTHVVLPVLPVRDVRPGVTSRRKIKSRHPFDIYEDQVEQLRILSMEDRMRGGAGSMSAMVREAIDAYIAKKRFS